MKKFVWTLLILLLTIPVFAQTTPPAASAGRKIAWDQVAPSLVEVQNYSYRVYVDGGTSPFLLPTTLVTCVNPGTAGAPFVCQTPFLPMTPGPHSITVTASNDSGESLPSTPFAFQFIVVPTAPKNVRLG